MATFSAVHSVRLGGMRPTTFWGFRRVPENIWMISLRLEERGAGRPPSALKACSIGSSNSPILIVLELREAHQNGHPSFLGSGHNGERTTAGLDSGRCYPNGIVEKLDPFLTNPIDRTGSFFSVFKSDQGWNGFNFESVARFKTGIRD